MIFNERFPIYEQTKNSFLLSTDPNKFDIDTIFAYLSKEAYWSLGIKREVIDRAFMFSLCFGVYAVENGRSSQAAFARVTTDYAKFAYIADVFVLEKHRGKGISKWLVKTIIEYPDLKGLRRMLLATSDAHGLYQQFGFTPLNSPELFMELHQPDVYLKVK